MRFSWWWKFRLWFSALWHHAILKMSSIISEEPAAFITSDMKMETTSSFRIVKPSPVLQVSDTYLTMLLKCTGYWMVAWFVNDKLGTMWKEAVVAYVKIPTQHLSSGIEENSEQLQFRQLVFRWKFEPGTSWLWNRNAHHWTVKFSDSTELSCMCVEWKENNVKTEAVVRGISPGLTWTELVEPNIMDRIWLENGNQR